MSHEALRKQHENQKPCEDENPNRKPGNDSQQQGNRNPDQDRNTPSNNPSRDPQRRQPRRATPQTDRSKHGHSRDAGNRPGGQTEKQNDSNRKHGDSSHENHKNADGQKARRSEEGSQPAQQSRGEYASQFVGRYDETGPRIGLTV
jgi:hypothetical protein